MMRLPTWICSLMLLAAPTCHAESMPPDIVGNWVVISNPTSANITAMPQAAATKLVGKKLTIRPKEIRFAQHKCLVENATDSIGDAQKCIGDGYKMDNADVALLGLPQNVRHIDAGCFEFYVKPHRPHDHLIFNQDGYFFEAKKLNR